MKLFRIESKAAAEKGFDYGSWAVVGEADTLPEAQALERLEYAKGWRSTRILTDLEQVDALRAEADRLRFDLDFYRKLAGSTP